MLLEEPLTQEETNTGYFIVHANTYRTLCRATAEYKRQLLSCIQASHCGQRRAPLALHRPHQRRRLDFLSVADQTVRYGLMAISIRQTAKREQIRAAARDLFLRHGFAETSMDAVTAAAGVSKQTLYHYYETKAQLFADVLAQLIAKASPPVGSPPPPPPPRTAEEFEASLLALCERYLTRLMKPDQLSLLRVVIAEGSRVPELAETFRTTVPAADAAAVMGVIQTAMARGLVAEWVDGRAAARALASMLIGFVLRDGLLAAEPRLPPREQLAQMIRIVVQGIGTRPQPTADEEVSP